MTSTPPLHGQLEDGPRGPELQLIRSYPVDVRTLWEALTVSDRLERWIGRIEGDPASGQVTFFMTAEGEDVEPEHCVIRDCVPERSFALDTSTGDGAWHLRIALTPSGEGTDLLFAQEVGEDPLGSIGPGWEYYLERLARALAGTDPDAVRWDAFFPALQEPYETLAR
ncbi:SRPBCC domain-containing protein [Brachybacterium hainanense]|uniref:SRPBCC domain-containing protein n=1 Tax=Brachybacterium hainanense TaxID=1541174 RepID=A0ABV6R7J5_9MICO